MRAATALCVLALVAGACRGTDAPVPPPEGFVDVRDTITRLCADATNLYECARAVEQYRLGKGVPDVARVGRRLTFTLGGGAVLDLTDASVPDAEDYVAYRYIEHLACFGHHLVRRFEFEDARYMLVHPATGARTDLVSLPILAPDCERLLTVSGGPDAGSVLQIWRLAETGRAALEWSYEPDELWVPGAPGWKSPTLISLPYATDADPQTRRTLTARLYTDGWHVER